MKLSVRFLMALIAVVMGVFSDINWLDVPFWIWLLWGAIFLIFELTKLNDKTIK